MEKPAATSVADAQVAEAEASARGLVLRTGYTHCHDTALRALADLVAGCAAPSWRLVWHKFAPGTGPSDIVWEYVPHVISIAHLLGGGVGPVASTITREPSETGTVEIAMGMGTAEVSTRPGIPRLKRITLFDSGGVVAEWTDRHLFDRRNNVTFKATEEPLANQVRSFFDEIVAPNPLKSASIPPEVATTELLVALASTIEPSAALN